MPFSCFRHFRLDEESKFPTLNYGIAGCTCIASGPLPRCSSFQPSTPKIWFWHKAKAQASSNNDKASKSYSKMEVSLHNKRTDCWIIIKKKVYDVTSYVEEHPGGDAILAHAGDDSTEGFLDHSMQLESLT
ncbi:hypothetical protein ACSQ67_009583 [Phaseolus vulgaris]